MKGILVFIALLALVAAQNSSASDNSTVLSNNSTADSGDNSSEELANGTIIIDGSGIIIEIPNTVWTFDFFGLFPGLRSRIGNRRRRDTWSNKS